MIDYVEARNSALAQLVAWAPANLRDDDELAVVNFAGTAGEVVGPYPVGDTGAATAPGAPAGGDNTNFTPLLDTVADLPPTSCDTALVLLSDGMLSDLPQNEGRGLDLLTAAGVHDLRLLVPSRSIDVPQEWSVAFPSAEPLKFEGNDPDATGLALARSIAALTQQEVRPA